MKFKVKDEDKTKEVLEALESIKDMELSVGITGEGEKYDDGDITVLGVATVHEFGYQGKDKNGRKMNIPERSFIRGAFDSKKDEIVEGFAKIVIYAIENGVDFEDSVEVFGEWGADITKKYLTSITDPPLKPQTIKAKGSSNPLIDTGRLRDSIDYKITKGGKE